MTRCNRLRNSFSQTFLFASVCALAWAASSVPAMAASDACIAANKTVLEPDDPGFGEGKTGPVFEPGIPFSDFEEGEVITVTFSNRSFAEPPNNADDTVYWETISGDDRQFFTDDSSVLDEGETGPRSFTRTVDTEMRESGESLIVYTNYGDVTVSCSDAGGVEDSLNSIKRYGTMLASQQSAVTMVTSVRSQAADRLPSCLAAEPSVLTKDSMPSTCSSPEQGIDLWGSLYHTGYTGDEDTEHQQINGYLGMDFMFSDRFLLGVFGGYENSSTDFDEFGGKLDGSGQSLGIYGGMLLSGTVRLDAALSRTWLSYDIKDQGEKSDFDANRTVASVGLSGTFSHGQLQIDPTADILAIWQNEDGYETDTGSEYEDRSFSSMRASAGMQFSITELGSDAWSVIPYAGLYGDYWTLDDDDFSSDGEVVGALEDLSGRVRGGIKFSSMDYDIGLDLSAQYSGIGADVGIVTIGAGLSVGF